MAGAVIPTGRPLVFPGAVPIAFDTPALQLSRTPGESSVSPSPRPALGVTVEPGRAGRSCPMPLSAALRACLTSPDPDPLCPMPTGGRAVPGTVRGAPPTTCPPTSR